MVDGVTGLLVDPSNVGEIAQSISRLLTDQMYARQLGENGRKRVVQALSWERVTTRFEQYLIDVTRGQMASQKE